MTQIVERLRSGRENASVLQLQLVKLRGRYDGLVFVFEGIEDVPVYEELIRKIPSCQTYEPLPARGKKQVLNLLGGLHGEDLIRGVYFFVDRDFDPPARQHNHLHELDAYSIENLLCTEEVLESVLKDELRCAGTPEARIPAKNALNAFLAELEEKCAEVNLHLFYARRSGRDVTRKPERINQIVNISLSQVERSYSDLSHILETQPACRPEELESAKEDWLALAPDLRQRGKYKLEAFRKWLKTLCEDATSADPTLFPESRSNIGDPASCSKRRFASCVSPPASLVTFCSALRMT